MEETKQPTWEICIVPNSLQVRNFEKRYGYECTNVSGHQVCVETIIADKQLRGITWMNCDDNPLGRSISDWIPVCIFYGKKEGDFVKLKFDSKEFDIKLSQSSTKWGGDFENTLYHLTCSFGGIYKPSSDKDLSELHQYIFMIHNHVMCATYIGGAIKFPNQFRFSKGWIKECEQESKKVPHRSPLEQILDNEDAQSNCLI